MKKYCLITGLILGIYSSVNAQPINNSPVDYVNTLVGSQSSFRLSNGNTYPAIGRPWGMNYWSPQTGIMGDGWMYTYSAERIRGFKQTHQPSPWMNDYGAFSIMPITGNIEIDENKRSSVFSHKAEIAKPYYYSVYLADYDITTALTATERAAHFQVRFPKNERSYIIVDAFDKGSYIKIIPSENKIVGYTSKNSGGVPDGFKNYFVLVFDKKFTVNQIWNDSLLIKGQLEIAADHVGAVVGFSTNKGEVVNVKTASSFISIEQAEYNLASEIGQASFEQTVASSKQAWNKVLGSVDVSDKDNPETVKTFYSCLYRAVLFPQKHYEINRQGKPIHYSPYNGKVLPGYMYAGTGFWDTFRALYPLLNLLYPSINKEMQEGLINAYKEGGFLPEWSSPGYRNIMIGNNSASVVADAYIKGLRGYEIDTLFKALLHGANNEGPNDAVGRRGVKYYNTLGYVPYDVNISESAARTLEYAYDDFAIWQLAKTLKRPVEEVDLFAKRMLNYKNVFDPETKLMRGKNTNKTFQSPFDPFKWGDAFTEGNSWHYTWSVFHDMEGLKNLMGGNNNFAAMLDSVFNLPPIANHSYYGYKIHEITEMQVMNTGQYAHGNQPIQHMIYLYNYAGQPWKTQYWTREVMNRFYNSNPDGYCGDDDNGQTSAWYIFSALGFYPVCPATNEYVLGAPLFKKATIRLENGKQVNITAQNNNFENKYINKLQWNNAVVTKNYINHFDLLKGGILNFTMQNKPNKQRGILKTDYPYSYSTNK
jgi:predicted alpha-1,2-mannosidase